ncbi:FAD-dependent monooxygenase [Streptomyces ipomoeae]|uniref:FAD-dependent monooxygenase n=3 Tax=Streptomyces ipomoeae TaxID=103232 RepID=A0A540Q507_9ACTN|nr:NAD(P)/FAD-dependent oxidoreductase [Streptomyces ipomoeae]MDX2933530.1 NAD(P)/FAD-dependent oxidoreductase [Streptomyces ipomoeae]TQE22233.1 FAD-dependent monooxygenase [Streptomyces ipomoeae]TQE30542.1 FAD-dependent monooxygenase [Streptomyces ipomoeae]TQE39005.1 FAD-dependent monooxygenase [Streptomyces ipomoeae]
MSGGTRDLPAKETKGAEDFDVVIVGARCAGSALGALLARRGLRVAVLDQATRIRSTLSSNILQADSLAFLERLGVWAELKAAGVTPMSHVDMRLEEFRCLAAFPLRAGDVGGAACIRREVLDPVLVDAARTAGAEVRLGTKVTGVVREGGRVSGVVAVSGGAESVLRARLVVGADGRTSKVAESCGARMYHVSPGERSYYWTYFEGADLGERPTFVFHRWGDRHMLGGPADNGLYIVGVSPQRHERDSFRADLEGSVHAHAMRCAPIAKALANATRAERIYGIRRFFGYFREAAGPGWVLLGDAGHFKDPAGGRGIGDAFHQAERLAPAIAAALPDPGRLDRAAAEFGQWRDRTYAEYYGLATDLGVAGPIAGVVPRVVRALHAKGKVDGVLDLLSHRASVLDVLTPGRVLGATGRAVLSGRGRRRAAARELVRLAGTEISRRSAMRRPVYQSGPEPHPVQQDPLEPEPSR